MSTVTSAQAIRLVGYTVPNVIGAVVLGRCVVSAFVMTVAVAA
ncbi:MAG: hypothetical protein R2705_19190 [Ilumatobacteraceae bacterium]